jgi:hypothetical protein
VMKYRFSQGCRGNVLGLGVVVIGGAGANGIDPCFN